MPDPHAAEASILLALPYILPSQAQKHVPHNEALRLLDLLVQLAVESREVTTPPASPPLGTRYIVPAGAVEAWAGQTGRLALWEGAAWAFFLPQPGWRAEVLDEGLSVVFDGSQWADESARAPWAEVRTSLNTMIDSNGFVKQSSPVLRLYEDAPDLAAPEWLELRRLGPGRHAILGGVRLARSGWQIELPRDLNANPLVAVELREVEGGA